ncbi:hypothetical protein BDZ45DRAFT_808947 [Acephala macrosclerotiorum]|nr:hypothetical protein BDZ45DRAFT_808947 [Acephala macrosclerotiorum]
MENGSVSPLPRNNDAWVSASWDSQRRCYGGWSRCLAEICLIAWSQLPSNFFQHRCSQCHYIESRVHRRRGVTEGHSGDSENTLKITHEKGESLSAIVVGTFHAYSQEYESTFDVLDLAEDGFRLSTLNDAIQILGQNGRGALYGAFEYLSMLVQGNFSKVAYASSPNAPVRWTNEWDNMDASIERGFGGPSIFFRALQKHAPDFYAKKQGKHRFLTTFSHWPVRFATGSTKEWASRVLKLE